MPYNAITYHIIPCHAMILIICACHMRCCFGLLSTISPRSARIRPKAETKVAADAVLSRHSSKARERAWHAVHHCSHFRLFIIRSCSLDLCCFWRCFLLSVVGFPIMHMWIPEVSVTGIQVKVPSFLVLISGSGSLD